MRQCLIYNSSLRFSRATYGILALVAFLIQNPWLVLATSILMGFGIISANYNFPYQLHSLFFRKLLKNRLEPIERESGELAFANGMGGSLFFIGFLFLYFGKFTGFAWGLILIDAFLMFLGCFAGVCVASLMYAFFKRTFKR